MSLKSIQLIADANPAEHKSAKGNNYKCTDLQGVLHFANGAMEVFVARLFPPRGTEPKAFKAGHYMPVLSPRVDAASRKLVAEITDLTPIRA